MMKSAKCCGDGTDCDAECNRSLPRFELTYIGAIARYKFLDYLRRTKFSFKNLPMESAEELTASSEFGAVESSLDLQRLMLRISSKAAARLNRAVMEFVYYCRR